jgi:hypothetical protein
LAELLKVAYQQNGSPVDILDSYLKVFLSGKVDDIQNKIQFNDESWDYRKAYLAAPLSYDKKKKKTTTFFQTYKK